MVRTDRLYRSNPSSILGRGTMKRFFICGDFDPRTIAKNWKWTPEVKEIKYPHRNGYQLRYVDIFWLGLQISFNNERD